MFTDIHYERREVLETVADSFFCSLIRFGLWRNKSSLSIFLVRLQLFSEDLICVAAAAAFKPDKTSLSRHQLTMYMCTNMNFPMIICKEFTNKRMNQTVDLLDCLCFTEMD